MADTLHQVFYRTFMATKDLLDLNLCTTRISFDLSFDQHQPVRHPKHMPQDSAQHSRRQWLLHWLFICHWKWVVCKRTVIWIGVKLIYLVASMKQDSLGSCFTSQQCLRWLHYKAIYSAAAADLKAECCFSNSSHEQLYISLCNFLLLYMETSTGILLDLALGLAEEHSE